MEFVEIPNLDIGPFVNNGSMEEKREIVGQIRSACEGIGFFTISGHGVSNESIVQMSLMAKNFFDLPLDCKKECIYGKGSGSGYLPMDAENLAVTLDKEAPADLKESFNVNSRPEKNMWPKESPEFKVICEAYSREMCTLASTLMKIFALALDLHENYFEQHITPPYTVLRFSNYPEVTYEPLPCQLRVAPHTDYGTLTILLPDSPGLQVSDSHGNWIDVNAPVNAFIVNLGDIMERWTNDRWKSTLHRVIIPDQKYNKRRQAIVFFHNPNDDAMISCLDVCCTNEKPARYKPKLARDLRQYKSHKSRENSAT